MSTETTSTVGRAGQPSFAGITLSQAAEKDPEMCERLHRLAGVDALSCGPYLHRTVAEMAAAEHIPIDAVIAAYQPRPSASTVQATGRGRPEPRLAMVEPRFNLTREIQSLRAETAWRQYDRNAKTLVKNEHIRVLLAVLKPGAHMPQHSAAGAITIQALSGSFQLHLPDQSVQLAAGDFLALAPGVPHDLEALEPSAFLLTISQETSR